MKTTLAWLAAALALISSASADWVMESKIESPQMNSTTVTKIKGDKVRTDMTGGPLGAMSSIIDTATGESTQLIHAQKMAMKTNAAQMKQAMEMAKKMSGAKPDAAPAKLQATGQKEKVGEFDCEIWAAADDTLSSKYWVALKHPQAAALKDMEKKMRAGVMGAQMGPDTSVLPGPTIKTEMMMMGNKTTITVLSIKEQPVDAKEFEVPADYQSMGMPTLPGGK